jgi:hypothetical protein
MNMTLASTGKCTAARMHWVAYTQHDKKKQKKKAKEQPSTEQKPLTLPKLNQKTKSPLHPRNLDDVKLRPNITWRKPCLAIE